MPEKPEPESPEPLTEKNVRDVFAVWLKAVRPLTSRTDVTVTSGWHSMTTFEKFKWWICVCVFPSIGKALRQQHDAAKLLAYRLDQFDPSGMGSYGSTPETPELPMWACEDPHQIVKAQAWIWPVTPMPRITLDIVLSPHDASL